MADTKETMIQKWVAEGYSPALAAKIVDDVLKLHFSAADGQEPALKVGQRIQISQVDSAILDRVPKPQPEWVHGVVHWIYADVLEVLDGGVAMVQVNHPGNLEHGTRVIVAPGQYRTKADVQKQLDLLPANPQTDLLKDLRRSLTVQVEILS